MLKDGERRVLVSFITLSLPTSGSPATVIPYVGSDIALTLPIFTRVIDIARWIVERCLEHDTPDLLVGSIELVDDGTTQLTPLVDLAERLTADPGLWNAVDGDEIIDWSLDGDPIEVIDGRPFVDRRSFRDILPRNNGLATPGCTVVQGNEGAGKTYLHGFCKRWAARSPDLRIGFSAAPNGGVSSFDPELAASDLAAGLGTKLNRMPRAHEDLHRHARNLAAWIADSTPTRPVPAIAILDGFDHPRLSSPVHTFVEELVRFTEDVTIKKRLRVVLLGYDVGRLETRNLAFDQCVLEHVGLSEIKEWLQKKYPDRPGYQYDEAAESIVDRLASDDALRMHKMCSLIQRANAAFQ